MGGWPAAYEAGRQAVGGGSVRADLLREAFKSKQYIQMVAVNKLDNDALNM